MTRRLPAPGTLSPMYHLFAASQQVGALLAAALADAPLDATSYAFYSAVRETQPTSPTDLARHLGMPVTTVLDTLAALQRKGHVARLKNPRDGRSYLVRLTDDGEQAHDATEVLFSEADDRLRRHLGDQRPAAIAALTAMQGASAAALAELQSARGRRQAG